LVNRVSDNREDSIDDMMDDYEDDGREKQVAKVKFIATMTQVDSREKTAFMETSLFERAGKNIMNGAWLCKLCAYTLSSYGYPLLISTVCANTNDLHKRVDKEGIIETAPGMTEPDEEDEEEEKEEETDNDEEEKSE